MEIFERTAGPTLRACMVAGPIFLTSAVLASLYLKLPKPILMSPKDVFGFLFILIPALPIGFLLALVPVMIGTGLLWLLGEKDRRFRTPVLWVATGAGAGALLAMTLGVASEPRYAGFALVVTSAVCALVSRKQATWDN